jgi:hypothetical protein
LPAAALDFDNHATNIAQHGSLSSGELKKLPGQKAAGIISALWAVLFGVEAEEPPFPEDCSKEPFLGFDSTGSERM